jgi:hypothetical protein
VASEIGADPAFVIAATHGKRAIDNLAQFKPHLLSHEMVSAVRNSRDPSSSTPMRMRNGAWHPAQRLRSCPTPIPIPTRDPARALLCRASQTEGTARRCVG